MRSLPTLQRRFSLWLTGTLLTLSNRWEIENKYNKYKYKYKYKVKYRYNCKYKYMYCMADRHSLDTLK